MSVGHSTEACRPEGADEGEPALPLLLWVRCCLQHVSFFTSSEDQTVTLGVAIGRLLRAGDVLALDGELGAGKTRLVRGIAEGLGLDQGQVSSPTYVIVHEYTKQIGRAGGMSVQTPLYHVDAYRLSGPDDLDSLGWERVVEGMGVVVIEWAARIASALEREPSLGRMRIQAEDETERRLDLVAPAAWRSRHEWAGLMAHAQKPEHESGKDVLPAGWARCPVTGRAVSPDSPTYPFVDERAKLADLGKWLSGAYVVSRAISEDDLVDPDLGPEIASSGPDH